MTKIIFKLIPCIPYTIILTFDIITIINIIVIIIVVFIICWAFCL